MTATKLMAEYIYGSSEDICQVCSRRELCNEKLKKDCTYIPKKSDCISGIIRYFNRKAEKTEVEE